MIALAAILTAAFAVRLWAAASWNLPYDDAWHIFAAGVDPFHQALAEIHRLAHPPLALFVLRPFAGLGESLVWPRLAAVLPSLASIAALYVCALRLRLAPAIALLGALVLALSYSHIQISVGVRGYALTILFLLGAFACFLDLIEDPATAAPAVVRRALCFTMLALWTEYCAVFGVAAMLIMLVILSIARRGYAAALLQLTVQNRFAVLAFGAALVALIVYQRGGPEASANWYLAQFLPDATAPIWQFALRGIASLLSDFTPFAFHVGAPLALTLITCAAAWVLLGRRFLIPASPGFDLRKGAALLMPLSMLALIFITAVCRLYPFGGYARHQVILFPFALLLLLIGLDTVYAALRSQAARFLLCGVSAIVVIAAAVAAYSIPPRDDFPPQPIWRDETLTTRRMLGSNDWLYATPFVVFGLSGNLPGWRWRFTDSCGSGCLLLVGERSEQRLQLIVDQSHFFIPEPLDAPLLSAVAGTMRTHRLTTLWMLSMRYQPPAPPQATAPATDLARHGLCLQQAAQFTDGELLRFTIDQPCI